LQRERRYLSISNSPLRKRTKTDCPPLIVILQFTPTLDLFLSNSHVRRGSGSACRSMFGGFVHWKTPKPTDNSTVVQLHPHTHWPELRINVDKKTVGSTVAMRTTMQSSCLFREARKTAVAERLPLFIKALQRCDFSALAELTMRESNALHAVCLDSWPPAIFLNETSFAVMQFVHIVNQHCGRTVVGA
ncbi:unnamed protein product, partial [Schistocephalus solidus]|uniref:MDD_C domain-containing protein n=1 Tax=Schistocephalus solidus TaxID=70667 RepID=A0A183TJA3_SCHSO